MATSKEQIKDLVKYYWNKAVEIYPNINKNPPRVYFFTKTVVAGYAWDHSHFVSFNTTIAQYNNPEDFEEVVAHEIAHRVQAYLHPRSKNHGYCFHRIMKALYGKSDEYHNLVVPSFLE